MTYSFRFTWAKDFNAVRDVLYNEGSIDVNIVPGMALPTDLPALIALRTKQKIDSVVAEFPAKTKVEFVGDKGNGIKVYKASFSKLGENMLTVRYGDGKWSTLQFFITEPLETVIKKRSSFLVNSMQHKDPSQWWYGVYSDWDQVNKKLRSPIDRDGLSPWLTDASDDAGNARPAYVASKNLFFPNQAEIDSVELYIKQYLFNGNRWDQGTGGMQMTEKEPYPYGIYGTFDNWYQHRTIDPTPPANFKPQNCEPSAGRGLDAAAPRALVAHLRLSAHHAAVLPDVSDRQDVSDDGPLRQRRRVPDARLQHVGGLLDGADADRQAARLVGQLRADDERGLRARADLGAGTRGEERRSRQAARAVERQGRAFRQHEDAAEPVRVGIRLRLDGLRIDGLDGALRHGSGLQSPAGRASTPRNRPRSSWSSSCG